MSDSPQKSDRIPVDLESRTVRYSELKPCTTAFIDTRTPGSAEKENFTIIGPGVSESPDQHIHISLPHGFNIGAARQPPGCVNSQHSHETPEVFVVHSGRWAFYLGENGDDGEVVLAPGDAISIPVHVFRGFANIGEDTGFLFAVLGGDDPGHVTWAPYVFANAREYGLVLLENGRLVDTTRGETIPEGHRPQAPTTADDVAALRRMTAAELADCVVRHGEPGPGADAPPGTGGITEYPIIGAASPDEGLGAGKMSWPHGFHVRRLVMAPGSATSLHRRHEEEVLLMHAGTLAVELPSRTIELDPGDVLTVPLEMPRRFVNRGERDVEAYVVRGGDHPGAAETVR